MQGFKRILSASFNECIRELSGKINMYLKYVVNSISDLKHK